MCFVLVDDVELVAMAMQLWLSTHRADACSHPRSLRRPWIHTMLRAVSQAAMYSASAVEVATSGGFPMVRVAMVFDN